MFSLRDLPKSENLEDLARRFPQTDPASVESFLITLRVVTDVLNALETHMARYGITQGRFIVMMLLQRTPNNGTTPSILADKAGVTRATMTGLLDVLERDGFVRRIQASDDRRNIYIHLTEQGSAFLDGMLPDHFRRIAALMQNLDLSEKKQLIHLLSKVNDGISALLQD